MILAHEQAGRSQELDDINLSYRLLKEVDIPPSEDLQSLKSKLKFSVGFSLKIGDCRLEVASVQIFPVEVLFVLLNFTMNLLIKHLRTS